MDAKLQEKVCKKESREFNIFPGGTGIRFQKMEVIDDAVLIPGLGALLAPT